MAKYPLAKIEKNVILHYFLRKPRFLTHKDEQELLDLLRMNSLEKFYAKAAKLIRSTTDVANLYMYLLKQLENKDISNEEIKNHVCWRLLSISQRGWLQVHDPEILAYCRNNATDKDLLNELKKIREVPWFDAYRKYVEKNVRKYTSFMKKLTSDNSISQKQYDELLERLSRETSIYKGDTFIGNLLSQKLQKELHFRIISPMVKIEK